MSFSKYIILPAAMLVFSMGCTKKSTEESSAANSEVEKPGQLAPNAKGGFDRFYYPHMADCKKLLPDEKLRAIFPKAQAVEMKSQYAHNKTMEANCKVFVKYSGEDTDLEFALSAKTGQDQIGKRHYINTYKSFTKEAVVKKAEMTTLKGYGRHAFTWSRTSIQAKTGTKSHWLKVVSLDQSGYYFLKAEILNLSFKSELKNSGGSKAPQGKLSHLKELMSLLSSNLNKPEQKMIFGDEMSALK